MVLTLPPTEDRSLSDAERSETIDRVAELLELSYRAGAHGARSDPVDALVHLALTKNAAGADRGTYRRLYRQWNSWDNVRTAPRHVVAATLKAGHVPAQRVTHVLELLEAIHHLCQTEGHAGTSLTWMRAEPSARAIDKLAVLPRLTRADAVRIWAENGDSPDLADDRRATAILNRLGLLDANSSQSDTTIPHLPRKVNAEALRVNLEHHTRIRCSDIARNCGDCPLISFCAEGRQAPRDEMKPAAFELFAGGGGLGEGFDRAGYDVVLAVEIDRDAAQTYRLNHPGTVVLEADATKVTPAQLTYLAPRVQDATVLTAGPPCQGYSAAGRRQANDSRNRLYTAVVDLAAQLKPRFVVIENVPGMRQVAGESYVDAVIEALDVAGYNAREQLLRACDFGVPQLRRRMIFLAQHKDQGPAPTHPEPSHCAGAHCKTCTYPGAEDCGLEETSTVLDELRSLTVLEHGQNEDYLPLGNGLEPLTNVSTMAHSRAVIDKIATIQPGAGPISYRRLHEDMARTIVAGHRALPVHPKKNRTISVREAARIQGFRDSHVFAGSRSKQPLQVANAVPPALGRAIADRLLSSAKTPTPGGAPGNVEPGAAVAPAPVGTAGSRVRLRMKPSRIASARQTTRERGTPDDMVAGRS